MACSLLLLVGDHVVCKQVGKCLYFCWLGGGGREGAVGVIQHGLKVQSTPQEPCGCGLMWYSPYGNKLCDVSNLGMPKPLPPVQ